MGAEGTNDDAKQGLRFTVQGSESGDLRKKRRLPLGLPNYRFRSKFRSSVENL